MIACSIMWGIRPLLLVFGILVGIIGAAGVVLGVVVTFTSSAVKATNGSVAEENLGIGTANMHKCKNCGVQLEEEKEICAKCEENLKP